MAFMPQEVTGKDRKLALPYHGQYRVVEMGLAAFWCNQWTSQVTNLYLLAMECVVEYSEELPDTSWLGKKKTRRRHERSKKHKYSLRHL